MSRPEDAYVYAEQVVARDDLAADSAQVVVAKELLRTRSRLAIALKALRSMAAAAAEAYADLNKEQS